MTHRESGVLLKVIPVLFFALFMQQANCSAVLSEKSIDSMGVYPDLLVTINGGNGRLSGTFLTDYTSADCSGAGGFLFTVGAEFPYISGNQYKANLARLYPNLFTRAAASMQLRVRDSTNTVSGFSACISVTCSSSTSCTFSPTTTTVTF